MTSCTVALGPRAGAAAAAGAIDAAEAVPVQPVDAEAARLEPIDAINTGYRRVLVAVDASPCAPLALACAASLARRDGARLTLLSTVGKPPWAIWLSPALPGDPCRLLEADCQARLRAAAEAVPASVPLATLLRRGSLAEAVLTELVSGLHDLAVVAAPRRRFVPFGARLGALPDLLRRSPVPVLVVGRP